MLSLTALTAGEFSFGTFGENTIGTHTPGWSDWVSIEAGSDHVCGLRSGGSFWCWGESANGRLGDGQTATDRTRPWPVSAF